LTREGAVITVRLLISGRVQGVAFRAFTRRRALALGLAGWVMNLPDGRVEVRVTGSREALDSLLGHLRQGPPAARVDAVRELPLEGSGDWSSFTIAY
jgi:acylphosphatase